MREQLLAANNFVMGTTNILIITLPDSWRMLEGHSAPEVDLWSEYRERRWMRKGQATYRLVQPHPEEPGLVRGEVELLVTAVPAERSAVRPARRVRFTRSGQIQIGGHEARYQFGTVRHGLIHAREVATLHLEFVCDRTARRLHLELSALGQAQEPAAAEAQLEELLVALAEGVRCH